MNLWVSSVIRLTNMSEQGLNFLRPMSLRYCSMVLEGVPVGNLALNLIVTFGDTPSGRPSINSPGLPSGGHPLLVHPLPA